MYDMCIIIFTCSCRENQDGKAVALVTGGCGCLGREIASQLIAGSRYRVHSLDLHIPPRQEMIAGVASYIQADITKSDDMRKALEGVEVVFHIAALTPFSIKNTHKAMMRVNVEGTRNVVNACIENGVKRLIYTSSCVVTMSRSRDHSRNDVVEESLPLPKDPLNHYAGTKGAAEMLVRRANGVNGLRTCALRLGGLMGGKRNPVMDDLARTYVRRVGVGDHPVAWTSLEAAIDVHLMADKHLEKKGANSGGNVFNIVSANIVYREMADFCAQESISGNAPYEIPLWFAKLMANINESIYGLTGYILFDERVNRIAMDYFRPCACSPERTERELGWAEHRPWQVTLKEVLQEYYRSVNRK